MQAPEITTDRIELKINLTDEQFWQLCQDNRDRNGNILVEILENPDSLSGEDVLPDFILDVSRIW